MSRSRHPYTRKGWLPFGRLVGPISGEISTEIALDSKLIGKSFHSLENPTLPELYLLLNTSLLTHTHTFSLQHAQTDNGRCRAWIRLAVNECSLESYINVLCQDNSLLSNYYETYSFLRDAEMVTALAQLLAGLSQLNINM